MSEYTLIFKTPLGDYQRNFDGVSLEELTNLAIVSIAIPLGGEDALTKALKEGFGATLAKAGEVSRSENGLFRFLGIARDQMFAIFEHAEPNAVNIISGKLKDSAYYTLQSDNWLVLRLTGPRCRDVLGRICLLDLDPKVFPEGKVARTVMDHLGVIIIPDSVNAFILISASSSATSLLHSLETSINNVL